MVAKVIELCAERERQVEKQRINRKRNVDGLPENWVSDTGTDVAQDRSFGPSSS